MENKKENKNGKITLERLARMVAEGFDKTSAKEELNDFRIEVKNKLAEHDTRFNKIDYRVDEIHEIITRFEEGDILDLQKRIKNLERAVKAMSKHIV